MELLTGIIGVCAVVLLLYYCYILMKGDTKA